MVSVELELLEIDDVRCPCSQERGTPFEQSGDGAAIHLTEVLDAACHIMDSWDVAKLEGEIFRAVQRISRSNDADRK
jgi:hypothetical protein